MALYFLEYDLRRAKELDYQRLYDELKKFQAVRMLESSWCFTRVNTTPEGLVTYFKQFIDKNDGLMISEVTNWAGIGLLGHPNQLKTAA